MNFSRFRVTLMCSLLAIAASAYAQTTAPGTPGVPTTQGATPTQTSETAALLPESDDDIPVEIIPRFDNAVSFGLRRLTKGPRVKFTNLGRVQDFPYGLGSTLYYSNGTVTYDGRGLDEMYRPSFANSDTTDDNKDETPIAIPADGIRVNNAVSTSTGAQGPLTSVSGGVVTFYQIIVNEQDENEYTVPYQRKRAYTEGQTRTWSYTNVGQLTMFDPGTGGAVRAVGMSSFSAESLGATAEAEGGPSSGFELKFERRLGRLGARFEYGFEGGFSLGDINGSQEGTVASRLIVDTEFYQLYGPAGTPAFTQPSGAAKTLEYKYTLEGTTTEDTYTQEAADTTDSTNISQELIGRSQTFGDVNVYGFWKLKGAYYMARVGPMFRYNFTERIAVSGSAGIAMAWVGTRFRAAETLLDLDTRTPVSNTEENETHKFVPGWYGELNAEYWLTERTGFYGGVSYQQMSDYTQRSLSGRSAKVDLGNSAAFQFGLITRF